MTTDLQKFVNQDWSRQGVLVAIIVELIEAGEWHPDTSEQLYLLASSKGVSVEMVTAAAREARTKTKGAVS